MNNQFPHADGGPQACEAGAPIRPQPICVRASHWDRRSPNEYTDALAPLMPSNTRRNYRWRGTCASRADVGSRALMPGELVDIGDYS
jgi:hypothetical protein